MLVAGCCNLGRLETMHEPSKRSAEFRKYPFLDAEEFAEACHQLDRRYTQATLGSLRRVWKLRVCRALDISFSASAEYATYIQIIRPLDGELDDGDLSACLDNFSFGGGGADTPGIEDHDMMEAEEADSVRFSVRFRRMLSVEAHVPPGSRSKGAKGAEGARFWTRHIRDPSTSDISSTLSLVQARRSTRR